MAPEVGRGILTRILSTLLYWAQVCIIMQHALIAEKVYSVTHTSRILFLCLSIHSVGNTSHTNFRIMKQFYTLYRILKQYSQRGGIRIVNFRDIPKYSQIRFACNICQLADCSQLRILSSIRMFVRIMIRGLIHWSITSLSYKPR